MCLRLVFLLITRIAAWLRLSRREEAWKTAEILLLRHQLAVLQRRQPRRPKLNWADRALIATLLSVIPTWRRSIPVTGRPARPAPHPEHDPGSCRTSRSGFATCASVVPGWPSCPPGFRPVFVRSDRDRGGGFANPSPDGGMEEFRDVFLSRSSSSAIRSCARASSPRSDTTSAASTS